MIEQFRFIADLVREQLKQVKQDKPEAVDELESIRGHDFMNDFANDEYVSKNIRVMPMGGGSSTYEERQSEHTSRHPATMGSAMRGGEESEFEEAKMNGEITMEIRDTRKVVKERYDEEMRRAKELAEKLAKKNKK